MRNHGDDATYRIGALERGLSILDALGESPGLSLMELASRLDVPKGSLFRQLRVLEASGYVVRAADTKRYWLGPRLIHLGYSARRQLKLADVAEPFMVALRDRFNESVHLGVLDQDEVVHVQATPSLHPVKMVAAVGERTWAHVSALGKVLLAWADPDLVEGVVLRKGLPRFTDQTLCTRAELEADLEQVRQRGYAIDDEESAVGLRCIAAPVRRGDGRLAAALSVSSPADRLSLGDAHAISGAIREAADSISEELGWRPDASPSPVDEGTSPQTWRD
jgi:IclR family transcriptional regulator, KDG regulon repressor